MFLRLRGSAMSSSSLLVVGLLTAALALVFLPAASNAAAPAAAAAAPDPGKDYFNMPNKCPQPGKVIPQRTVGCRLTPWVKSRPTVMVWGDSHAWQHLPALVPLAKKYNVNLTAFTLGGCPPVYMPHRAGKKSNFKNTKGRLRPCHWSNALALHYAKKMSKGPQPFLAVVGSHWAGFRDHYQRIFVEGQTPSEKEGRPYVMEMSKLAHKRTSRLFDALDRNRIRTVATSQAATVPYDAHYCALGDEPFVCSLDRQDSILHEGRTRRWLKNQMAGVPGSPDMVDVNGAYCGPQKCRGKKNGIYTWYDDLHLSATRVKTLKPYWRPLITGLRG